MYVVKCCLEGMGNGHLLDVGEARQSASCALSSLLAGPQLRGAGWTGCANRQEILLLQLQTYRVAQTCEGESILPRSIIIFTFIAVAIPLDFVHSLESTFLSCQSSSPK